MKKQVLAVAALLSLSTINQAQVVADFENLPLVGANSFWNGSESYGHNNFTDGNAFFHNYITTTQWGDWWQSGWAYSNMIDTVTEGTGNMYAARPGEGAQNSQIYAIGKQNSRIVLTGESKGKALEGMYISNTTYTALSMQNGDQFGKQFGGESGEEKDWCKLSISKWYQGEVGAEQVEVYLADYRFDDADSNYILNTWKWVDLSPLGLVDSLKFAITSSDVGEWGMNTPAFFALDNLTTYGTPTNVTTPQQIEVQVYPNPCNEFIWISGEDLSGITQIRIFNTYGKLIAYQQIAIQGPTQLALNHLSSGVYVVQIQTTNGQATHKIIKQ